MNSMIVSVDNRVQDDVPIQYKPSTKDRVSTVQVYTDWKSYPIYSKTLMFLGYT